ncbi:MAG: 3-phosphoserine/phosphohydroxythreonine transaminase [Planctomycetes bacterium]|nr:3-phosphoserine/phosphohydroxythreonine transaminase [Planctomycetota bacterium]
MSAVQGLEMLAAVRPMPGGRVFNFSAGPAAMPLEVLEQLRQDLLDLNGSGIGILEHSHRGPVFDALLAESHAAFMRVAGAGKDWAGLFIPGGATLQFGMLPMNFLPEGGHADYADTGLWTTKAIADAKMVGKVNLTFDGKSCAFSRTPRADEAAPSKGAAYHHWCSNNTVDGTKWSVMPTAADGAWLARDASSDIFAEPLDLSGHGFVYAAAQKNLGPSGMTMVLIRRDLLEKSCRTLPSMLRYDEYEKGESRPNTPNTFGIHVVGLMCRWIEKQGGVKAMERLAAERSDIVLKAIDDSGGFWKAHAERWCQSPINVLFRGPSAAIDAAFVIEAAAHGMDGLAGHRSTGGIRASMYNAMPVAGARALADFMRDFARRRG